MNDVEGISTMLNLLLKTWIMAFGKIIGMVDHCMTWFVMHAMCDKVSLFHTAGVPFVRKSRKSGRLLIGNGLVMNNGMRGNQLGFGHSPCVFLVDNAMLNIGEDVKMSQTAFVAFDADIVVGDRTLFGAGVKVYSSDFHSLDSEQRGKTGDRERCKRAPIFIGEDCFIGAGTLVLKGVTIGDRTVVGAGSVVTKDIPADCIAAGNPCKVIRRVR